MEVDGSGEDTVPRVPRQESQPDSELLTDSKPVLPHQVVFAAYREALLSAKKRDSLS